MWWACKHSVGAGHVRPAASRRRSVMGKLRAHIECAPTAAGDTLPHSRQRRGRAMLAPTRVFASLGPKYSCPPHGSLPHRLRAEPPRRGGQEKLRAAASGVPSRCRHRPLQRRGGFHIRPWEYAAAQTPRRGQDPSLQSKPLKGLQWQTSGPGMPGPYGLLFPAAGVRGNARI